MEAVTVLVSGDAPRALSLAAAWRRRGSEVTVVLLDGATALARPGHADADALRAACAAGVAVVAHDDALRRRGLLDAERAGDIRPVDLDAVADLVTTGSDRALWL